MQTAVNSIDEFQNSGKHLPEMTLPGLYAMLGLLK